MKKELEKDIDRIEFIVDDYLKVFTTVYGDENEVFKRIKQALTPPTSDDVCKALSEYYKTNVFCRKHEHQDVPAIGSTFIDTFYYLKIKTDVNGIEYKTERIIVLGDSVDVSLNASLPPHLITMIGRFYESESEKE